MCERVIPYGRQNIDDNDIAAVVAVLKSDWLTTGPQVGLFEQALADYLGIAETVAVSSGTAALHAMLHVADIGPGDEVIVPALTFAATANAVADLGAKPIFADVDPDTLLIDPTAAESLITPATKAIIGVDYAGQGCDYGALRQLSSSNGVLLLADACHSLGGQISGRPCGAQADMTAFSFHPVKSMTTAEGGAVVTNNELLAQRLRCFRNHGISSDHLQRQQQGEWFYEMTDLGFNYRLSDLHAALGVSQLHKLNTFISRRRKIAARYRDDFKQYPQIRPLKVLSQNYHAFHLYVVRVANRDTVFRLMREAGILVNVHYVPVYLHPWYRMHYGTSEGLCPVAEEAYKEILSLPIFPDLNEIDQDRVVERLLSICS